MAAAQLLRVVALRKSKLKPAEFRLRDDETALSMFEFENEASAKEIIEAVRAAGKEGDLTAVVLNANELRSLGLVVVRTPGETPSPQANQLHVEARLSFLTRLSLFFRGIRGYDYFNDILSKKLCALAKPLE